MVHPQLVRCILHSSNKFYRAGNVIVRNILIHLKCTSKICPELCPKAIILQDPASFWEGELSPEDLGKQGAFSGLKADYSYLIPRSNERRISFLPPEI